ncbi:MAG: hypothetical protein WCT37_00960 [Patescibacteria group bacterium]|jgi:hypothetical protein
MRSALSLALAIVVIKLFLPSIFVGLEEVLVKLLGIIAQALSGNIGLPS